MTKEGDNSEGERLLELRRKHRKNLLIRPLSAEDEARFNTRWIEVRNQFVDDRPGAVARADGLITEVMQTRGYPSDDFTHVRRIFQPFIQWLLNTTAPLTTSH